MGEKLTKAQFKVLRRLSAEPGLSIMQEMRDRPYPNIPSFHASWYGNACPTCRHAPRLGPVSWRAVYGLVEGGFLKSIYASEDFLTAKCITPAGHAALAEPKQ